MKKIFFVCIGNSCRSQMAEGFANAYGDGLLKAESAGTHPSGYVNADAVDAMREEGIDISHQSSKGIQEFDLMAYDAVISLCDADTDQLCPANYGGVKAQWNIPDPVGKPLSEFRRVRNMIEERVRQMIEEMKATE